MQDLPSPPLISRGCCSISGGGGSTSVGSGAAAVGKTLANFIMFFESTRRYDCQLEARHFDQSQALSRADNCVIFRSQTPIECHRGASHVGSSSSAPAAATAAVTTMTTTELAVMTPKPAPRKSLNQHIVSTEKVAKQNFVSVKQQATRFQQQQKLTTTTNLMNNKPPSNNIHPLGVNVQHCKFNDPSERTPQLQARTTSGHGHANQREPDSGSSDDGGPDTEDSAADNRLAGDNEGGSMKPKPGRLDLRQFDNITTAIGKLNVQTPPTTASSSSLLSSKPVESTPNARRTIQIPRQNHGRAVAPPQLPANMLVAQSKGASKSLEQHMPANESMSQLANDESAIDFNQSPIAQRLLKHSKDHKVSELMNSPYESDNEQAPKLHTGFPQSNRDDEKLNVKAVFKQNDNPTKVQSRASDPAIDSNELINSRGAAIRQLNEILANKQHPGRPGGPSKVTPRANSFEQEQGASATKKDKDSSKKEKKKLRSDEKLEKRKLKEEERLRRQEEEKQRRQEKKLAAKKSKSGSTSGSNSVGDDGIPLFIKRCIEFIEFEGLDAEGIYRVPGNRAHVDAFVQKFKENPDMSIADADIPVNAVATALKDFLSKKWGPIIPLNLMNELTELSSIPEKERRVNAVRDLVQKLPPVNYRLLKYVFSHFVKISHNHSLNSMDSKNLAICWWPTLLPLHFNDMVMFEQMRPHLEESIQTMIDQYSFIFDTEEPSGDQS